VVLFPARVERVVSGIQKQKHCFLVKLLPIVNVIIWPNLLILVFIGLLVHVKIKNVNQCFSPKHLEHQYEEHVATARDCVKKQHKQNAKKIFCFTKETAQYAKVGSALKEPVDVVMA